MKQWLLIGLGILLVSWALLWPGWPRNSRAASGLIGGVMLVIGLAPGRVRYPK